MRFFLVIGLSVFISVYDVSAILPRVNIITDKGIITLEIDNVRAPITANNFLNLVKQGVYTNSLFYRVVRLDNQPDNNIKIEVIQGGLFEDSEIDRYPSIKHETTKETGIEHLDGVISMARNSPGTASTEFFICIGDQAELNFGGVRNPDQQGFSAFGKVVEGMDVLRNIQKQKDKTQYLIEPVKIEGIERCLVLK